MPEPTADREPGQAGHPTLEDVRRLAEWQPELGVVSVYLRVEPGDRGGAWRTELRNGLAGLIDRGQELDHRTRTALRATAERIGERFANHERGMPRGEVGFVEVSEQPARESWWQLHVPPAGRSSIRFDAEPLLAPLLSIADRTAPRGAALVSAERVRLLEWRPGRLEELHAWELSMFSRDWRERKSQRPPDPARAQAVSASGRDQYGQRLEENRNRFLGECRGLAVRLATERDWRELLAFGSPQYVDGFRDGGESSPMPIATGGEVDLISTPQEELERHIAEAAERRDGERQRALVERALEEARGGTRGTAGPQETLAALEEGRVECLIVDAALAMRPISAPDSDGERGVGEEVDIESLVRRAIASAASIAVIFGDASPQLAEAGGIAALLRY